MTILVKERIEKLPPLVGLLHKWLASKEEKRFTADTNYLHVGDLFNLCMRQVYLAHKHKVEIVEHINPSTRLLFEMGIAVENIVKSWIAQIDILAESHPSLYDHDLRIVGTPDGRMKNKMLLEIKAMNPALFRLATKHPLRKHQFQLESYLMLDKGKKGLLFSATWAEQRVPYRSQTVHFNIKTANIIKKVVSSLREAEAGGPIPGRVCESANEPRAICCPLYHQCFALDNPKPAKTIEEELRI